MSGYRHYSQEQLNYFLGLKQEVQLNKKTIGYCRVSSHKQKDDLERQIDNVKTYMYAKGYSFEIISDIGSGINYNKKGVICVENVLKFESYTNEFKGECEWDLISNIFDKAIKRKGLTKDEVQHISDKIINMSKQENTE